MEDFNLILRELMKKDDIEKINIPLSENLKKEFETTAERYIKNGNLLDAIKVFALIKNKEKLISTSELCLKDNSPYESLQGFLYANSPEHLNKIGFVMMQIPDVNNALIAFKKAKNFEMINFIELNLL